MVNGKVYRWSRATGEIRLVTVNTDGTNGATALRGFRASVLMAQEFRLPQLHPIWHLALPTPMEIGISIIAI